MDPDKAHAVYPHNMHTDTALNTQRQLDRIDKELDTLRAEVKTKVSQSQFTWVIGIVLTSVLGLLGVIYTEVKNNGNTNATTQQSVAKIEGILSISEIE